MAAHYRLKYGINENELSKSLPASRTRHAHNSTGSMQSTLSTSMASTVVSFTQEDSNSDSDDTKTDIIPKPSPHNIRRHRSHEPQVNSSATLDFRRQSPKTAAPNFRHSSYTPSVQSGYDRLCFTKEDLPNNGYVNVPKEPVSSSLLVPHQYDYVRNRTAVSEEITEVYESSPRLEQHQYQNIDHPMDTQGT